MNRDNKTKPTNHEVAQDGIETVMNELEKFGLNPEVSEGRKKVIRVSGPDNSHSIQIRVKTKYAGKSWHSDIRLLEEQDSVTPTFWIFVNLNRYASPPEFWIVPEPWLKDDIRKAHQKYLDRYDGHRAENDASTHHSIDEARIADWKDKWETLGIIEKKTT